MSNHIRNVERAHMYTFVPSLFIILMISALSLDAFFPNPIYSPLWAREAGIFSLILGSILLYWAHVSSRIIRKEVKHSEKGANFFVGPYKYVRHPSYLGMVLISLGISLIMNSTIILIATILFYVCARAGVMKEEQHLLHEDSHVKEHYSEYSKKVKRFF